MSYILDALRRAEQERQRGSAPGVHTPAVAPMTAATARAPLGLLPWLAVAGALLLGAAATYWWLRPTTNANSAVPASAPVVAAAPAPVIAMAPQPSPPAPPRAVAAPQPAPHPSQPAPAPRPADSELPTLAELPPAERQALPPLAIGGYIYAERAAERTVIVNQRLLHEGEQITPGLTLERMTPAGMILDFRGRRFRLAY